MLCEGCYRIPINYRFRMGGRKRFEHATHFHVAVVQKRQRNVQKSVMHVRSCCFAH